MIQLGNFDTILCLISQLRRGEINESEPQAEGELDADGDTALTTGDPSVNSEFLINLFGGQTLVK